MKDKAWEKLQEIGEGEGIGDSPGDAFLLGFRLRQESESDLETYKKMLDNSKLIYTSQDEGDGCVVVDVEFQGEDKLGYAGFVSLHRFNSDGKLIAVGGAE